MTDDFRMVRFADYMVDGYFIGDDYCYYVASYCKEKKFKGLFLVTDKDFSNFGIDKSLLDSWFYRHEETDDDWEPFTDEENSEYSKYYRLPSNRGFLHYMYEKEPTYKVFTTDEGYEFIWKNGKQKYIN